MDLKRLTLPLLPLAEQRRYGDAFRDLHRLRRRIDAVRRSEDELQERIASGMRAGLLEPRRTGGSEPEHAAAVPHIRQT
ncbi:hypothetical protein [Nocardiopsis salina]|uniref:hypothetical protein n=1 Tax=Nocardiopsis salina TaxID=245836 RepID=UPI001268446D|nr:hypothetical protein [Nocardiopsis salina]